MFLDIALAFKSCDQSEESTGAAPTEIFLISLVCQNPPSVHLLKGSLLQGPWPDWQTFAETPGLQLGEQLVRPCYDIREAAFAQASGVGSPDSIVQTFRVLHTARGMLVQGSPVEFDEFCLPFLQCGKEKRAKQNSDQDSHVVPKRVAEKLREEFPWLTEQDLKVMHRAVTEKPPVDKEPLTGTKAVPNQVIDKDFDDAACGAVWDKLQEKRDEWARDDEEDTTLYFYTQVLGGAWTAAHKGVAADAMTCKARSWAKPFL